MTKLKRSIRHQVLWTMLRDVLMIAAMFTMLIALYAAFAPAVEVVGDPQGAELSRLYEALK